MQDPILDDEFVALIPPLTQDEYVQLELNINKDGCRDALVVWDEENLLLDGHNRLKICKVLGADYRLHRISLPDRNAAIAWVIKNQFGRRNLTSYQRGELALRLKPIISAKAKENQRAGGGSGSSGRLKSDEPTDTKEELAKTAGIARDTLHKVEVIAEHADEETKTSLRDGTTSINAAYNKVKPKGDSPRRNKSKKLKRPAPSELAKTISNIKGQVDEAIRLCRSYEETVNRTEALKKLRFASALLGDAAPLV